jgi:nicotinamidase-related amidase
VWRNAAPARLLRQSTHADRVRDPHRDHLARHNVPQPRELPRLSEGRARASVALLLIDVINGFDFPGSEALVGAAHGAAPHIARLAERARRADVPVVYVNDNFGRWRSDFRQTFDRCTASDQPGHEVTALLRPRPQDYFVLKPKHSGFFATPLELMLQDLRTHTLILVGFATNLCVALTAYDAHMRGYRLCVPSDCTASNSKALTAQTLRQLRISTGARISPSTTLRFDRLYAEQRHRPGGLR